MRSSEFRDVNIDDGRHHDLEQRVATGTVSSPVLASANGVKVAHVDEHHGNLARR
jgi:hypothetical protein